jgi:tetratricopeptide (TPR) repeat protein
MVRGGSQHIMMPTAWALILVGLAFAPLGLKAQEATAQEAAWERHLTAATEALDLADFTTAERAVAEAKKTAEGWAPDDPRRANLLMIQGQLHNALGEYQQASAPLQRAVEIREKALGPNHRDLAKPLLYLVSRN